MIKEKKVTLLFFFSCQISDTGLQQKVARKTERKWQTKENGGLWQREWGNPRGNLLSGAFPPEPEEKPRKPSRSWTGAHQMEPPSLLISWVNPFPSRFINRTIFFCNALESHECACCLLSFLYFHWLFPLSARETFPVNRSIYKSTRERVDSKGLYGRCRLHLMVSWSWSIV